MGTLAGFHFPQMDQGSYPMSVLLSKPCDFCGHSYAEPHLRLKDLRLNLPGTWNLVKCEKCGLLMLDPQPTWEELAAHYPKEYHAYLGKVSGLAAFLRRYGFKQRVKSILRRVYIPNGRLLDVGCATGDFLQAFHELTGWDVDGVEIVPEAAAAARAKGLKVVSSLEDSKMIQSSFDVITLWDVLEHMPDPSEKLQLCNELLKPEGILVIKCPDPEGKEASMFRQSWIGYEAPQHLYGFPKKVLLKKLTDMGLEITATRQTGSDYASFFVSLGHWLIRSGWNALGRFIINAAHKPFVRLIAGILVRPLRWVGVRSSSTYYCKKKRNEESQ